jgi:hypothetical protein
MYLDLPDLPLLQDFLNAEEEIVFLISSEHATYATVESVALQPNAGYTLWHVPSGEIPPDCRDSEGRIVVDPWRKGHLGALRLRLEVCPGKYQQLVPRSNREGYELRLFEDNAAIGRSSFGWIGNKFSVIGERAHPATERWWKRLRRCISKQALKIASYGALESPDCGLQVWAFPAAYSAIVGGRPRSVNPVLWEIM